MVRVYLDHVTKVFPPRTVAVDDVTLEIKEGELVGLLGPSGCGKTTTLRIIAGLEKPTKGRVYFDDEDVTNKESRDRNVAMVFQFPILFPTISVYENIALSLRSMKMREEEVRREVKKIAEFMGINEHLEMKPGKLDIGVRQKVSLAKALVRNPSIFILDEPLTVIDPKTRVELRTRLKQIQLNLGKSMIYVTHDQAEALTLAERIAIMKDGKILQYDVTENLYDRPSNSFVAWFIGNPGMNLIECNTSLEGDSLAITNENGFRYCIKGLGGTKVPNRVVFGIRPEYVRVEDGKDSLQAKCIHVEHVGNRQILHLEFYGESLKAKVPLGIRVRPGEIIPIKFIPEKIRIFDHSTRNLII